MTESFMTQSLKENIQIEIHKTFTTFPAGTILYAIPDLALGAFLSLSFILSFHHKRHRKTFTYTVTVTQ